MAFSSVAVVSNSLLLRRAATHLEGAEIEGPAGSGVARHGASAQQAQQVQQQGLA